MIFMATRKKRVSFWARKPIKVPKKVSFTTRDGRKVNFTARETIKKRKKVSFLAKK